MTPGRYDVAIAGGGIAGASLARALAQHGVRVLVVEREARFKDRVRGEQLTSWGVDEARRLGVVDVLRDAGCAHEIRWWQTTVAGHAFERRDCVATTPQAAPQVTFFHPAMQEALLAAAEDAGATVWRDARVSGVVPGTPARVEVEHAGGCDRVPARLVVAADGRTSAVRRWARFAVRRDPPARRLAGVLLDGMHAAPQDAIHWYVEPACGVAALLAPQGGDRVRAYVVMPSDAAGGATTLDLASFLELAATAGAPRELFAGARQAGPLACFDGADTWVPHPYAGGVALVGDAAASNDPSFGQGLSLSLRDVRTLAERVVVGADEDAAAHAWAAAHDRAYATMHAVTGWIGAVFYDPGREADARRARAMPRIAEDPTRLPDHLFGGPDLAADDPVRRRFFGED